MGIHENNKLVYFKNNCEVSHRTTWKFERSVDRKRQQLLIYFCRNNYLTHCTSKFNCLSVWQRRLSTLCQKYSLLKFRA